MIWGKVRKLLILSSRKLFPCGVKIYQASKLIRRWLRALCLISLLTISHLIRLNLWWMLLFFTTTQSQNIGTSSVIQQVDPKIVCKENLTVKNTSMILSWAKTFHRYSETSQEGSSLMRMVTQHGDMPSINCSHWNTMWELYITFPSNYRDTFRK